MRAFTVRTLLLFLILLGTADAVTAQARLRRSSDGDGRADTLSLDRDERRAAVAQHERELDRLRRRTGTANVPGDDLRGPQRPPLFTADGGFTVLVDTDSPEYLVGETSDDTEPMFIRLRSAEPGYLTLLSGGVGRDFVILAPNDLIASFPIRADETIDFPLRDWVRLGIDLLPQLPDDVEISQQSLVAVVTRRPIPLPLVDFNLGDPRDGDRRIAVRTFQTWLSRLPLEDRGIGQAFYLVRRR
jgi:hypothetical protein